MRHRRHGRAWLAAATVISMVLAGAALQAPAAFGAVGIAPDNPCLSAPEDINHENIRLAEPAEGTRVPVDEHGKITIAGVLHKQAAMDDVTVGHVVTTAFTFGPPPDGISDWAASWTTSVRPPHLGSIQVCARAQRDPKWRARVLRDVTVVDLIPPSNVPNLLVVDITSTSAKATWDAATDNYGLAGYEVSVDGGAAVRTTVGTRSYAITGLSPTSGHTVSVVAVDLAGNRSTTAATASFTTTAAPPPPNPNTDVVVQAREGSAVATWHPAPDTEASYQILLDGAPWDGFTVDQFCQDAQGNPASPCTAQDVISYPTSDLDQDTPYTFQVQALAADGTVSRTLSTTFTTVAVPPTVPVATTALIASESSRCAAVGGDVYLSPSVRAQVALPVGATPRFDGCYTVLDSHCVDQARQAGGDQVITGCSDDVTRLLYSVAPPGRGPVISAMEGTTTTAAGIRPAYATNPVKEAINWCFVEDPATCVTAVGTTAEAVAGVAAAGGAAAVGSLILAAALGVGLGLVLGTLATLLWPPTSTGIANLSEYPGLNFDTNFDTFTDWGEANDAWIGSLKTYAEVIKTTTQVAAQQGLPFAWDALTNLRLTTAIDTACGVIAGRPPNEGNVCPDDMTVYVPGGTSHSFNPMQQTGQHIADALGAQNPGGFPSPAVRSLWFYPAYSKGGAAARAAGFTRDWYTRQQFRPNACDLQKSGEACDEFPFFTTNQAVNLTLADGSLVADVKPTPSDESNNQGDDMSTFYRQCLDFTSGRHFVVLPVPSWIAAGGPSFGFNVNQGGASLCMKPQP